MPMYNVPVSCQAEHDVEVQTRPSLARAFRPRCQLAVVVCDDHWLLPCIITTALLVLIPALPIHAHRSIA